MAESILISLLALAIAIGLAELFLSAFERFTGMELLGNVYEGMGQLGVIMLMVLIIGGLAGLYPAFYLSKFKPVSVLKGNMKASDNRLFRNGLVVVQFAISGALLICMGLIYEQLEFMQQKDLGLETKNVLVIQNAEQLGDRQDAFRESLSSRAGIGQVSISSRIPAGKSVRVGTFPTPKMDDGLPVQTFIGDYNYLSVLGFHLREGRNFPGTWPRIPRR